MIDMERGMFFDSGGSAEQLAELHAALAKAHGAFGPISKSKSVQVRMKSGGTYEYHYATIADLRRATAKPLAENGLAVTHLFCGSLADNSAAIVTRLTHASGAYLESAIGFRPYSDIKELGGQTTYLRRYAYQCLLGLEGEENIEEDPRDKPERATTKAPPKEPDGPDVYARLAAAKKRAGLGDAHAQSISRTLYGRQVGQLEDREIHGLALLLEALTTSEIAAIKDGNGDESVGACRDRLKNARKPKGGADE